MFTSGTWGAYDLIVGTSERGEHVDTLERQRFNHCIVVFGGVKGLEYSFSKDTELKQNGIENVVDLFDKWINTVPKQGSRTIRTEEAILVSLSALRDKLF